MGSSIVNLDLKGNFSFGNDGVLFFLVSPSLSFLLLCHKFQCTAALWLAESATLFLPKAQKTLLFTFSLRPSINYRLWVLENGKYPQEINLLQLSVSKQHSHGWLGRMLGPHQIEKSSKKPCVSRCHPSSASVCQLLTEGLI